MQCACLFHKTFREFRTYFFQSYVILFELILSKSQQSLNIVENLIFISHFVSQLTFYEFHSFHIYSKLRENLIDKAILCCVEIHRIISFLYLWISWTVQLNRFELKTKRNFNENCMEKVRPRVCFVLLFHPINELTVWFNHFNMDSRARNYSQTLHSQLTHKTNY